MALEAFTIETLTSLVLTKSVIYWMCKKRVDFVYCLLLCVMMMMMIIIINDIIHQQFYFPLFVSYVKAAFNLLPSTTIGEKSFNFNSSSKL
jgi:hypothetical protein